jgi:uncharacterized protein YdaU (DUF1376 family)
MKVKPIKAEYMKVLKRIQDSVPQEWLNQVTKKEIIGEPIKEIIAKAMVDPEVSQETKDRFQMISDSGYLDKEKEVENKEITRQIDEYIDNEIKKAIARGELPKGKKHRNMGKKLTRIIKTKNGTSKK